MVSNPFEQIETRLNEISRKLDLLSLKADTPAPQPKVPENRLLTIDETASMLKVSRVTLWQWAKQDKLSPVVVGSVKRYRLSDIQQIGDKV